MEVRKDFCSLRDYIPFVANRAAVTNFPLYYSLLQNALHIKANAALDALDHTTR